MIDSLWVRSSAIGYLYVISILLLSRVIIFPSWGQKVSPPKTLFSVSVN